MSHDSMINKVLNRRDLLRRSLCAGGAVSVAQAADVMEDRTMELQANSVQKALTEPFHSFNGIYQGPSLNQIAFPMGGIGAGMICLEGTGALSKFSLRHDRPALEPNVFAAVAIKGAQPAARI